MRYTAKTHRNGYVRYRDTKEPVQFLSAYDDTPVPGTDGHTTIERFKEHPLWAVFQQLGERKFRKQFPKAHCPPARWCAEEHEDLDGNTVHVPVVEKIVGPFEWATFEQWDTRFGPVPPGHGPKGPPKPMQPTPPPKPRVSPAPPQPGRKRPVAGELGNEAPSLVPNSGQEALATMNEEVRAVVAFPRVFGPLTSPPPGCSEGIDIGTL